MVKKFIRSVYLALLRTIARLEIKKHKDTRIIGIAGSSGKTSCRDMLVAFLKPYYKDTLKSTTHGSYGVGILYEILDIPVRTYHLWQYPIILFKALLHLLFSKKKYDVFIIEYGVKGTGLVSMEQLLRIVPPDIGILLPISSAHSMFYEQRIDISVPQAKKVNAIEIEIARENFKLLQAIKDKKRAFYVPQIKQFIDEKDLVKMTEIGTNEAIQIAEWENSPEGITVGLRTSKGTVSTFIPGIALPQSARANMSFAAQVTTILKKNLQESLKQLAENLEVAPGRSSLLAGIKGTTIIDSSYNANPLAAKELFAVVKELAQKGRRKKIIVLGDFRELGESTEVIYKEVIREAAKVANILVLTNELMKKYGLPAAEREGFVLNSDLYWFENGRKLSFHIAEIVEKNAVVLFEGSQNGIFLEYAVEELLEIRDKEYIKTHLPRMSREWLRNKARQTA